MPVQTVPQKFKSNGREFNTQEEAERFDRLCNARQKLEDAQHAFQRILAENGKTADGEPFKFGLWTDYFYILEPFYSLPQIVRLQFICWSWSVREDGQTIEIRDESDERKPKQYVPISKLYKSEAKAKRKLLEARRAWLIERSEQTEKESI